MILKDKAAVFVDGRPRNCWVDRTYGQRPACKRYLYKGFYGAHVRSMGAVRSYWFFMSISVVVDFMWIFTYSPMRPIAWDTLKAISRKDQVRAPLPPWPDPHLCARGTRRQ